MEILKFWKQKSSSRELQYSWLQRNFGYSTKNCLFLFFHHSQNNVILMDVLLLGIWSLAGGFIHPGLLQWGEGGQPWPPSCPFPFQEPSTRGWEGATLVLLSPLFKNLAGCRAQILAALLAGEPVIWGTWKARPSPCGGVCVVICGLIQFLVVPGFPFLKQQRETKSIKTVTIAFLVPSV